jgi:hypothetical protein
MCIDVLQKLLSALSTENQVDAKPDVSKLIRRDWEGKRLYDLCFMVLKASIL